MSDWLFYYETVVRHDVPVQYMDIDVAYFQMDGASTIQCELYKKEKRNYLASRLGWDILLNLEELTRYRQCKLSRVALDCRLKLKDLFIVKVLSKYWFKWGKIDDKLKYIILTYHQITPQNGGIERVSDLVAEEFEIIGIRCFSAYFILPNIQNLSI